MVEGKGVKTRATRSPTRWQRVIFASSLPKCPFCREEPWCRKHQMHYSECDCIGPDEETVEYRETPKGTLMGRRKC